MFDFVARERKTIMIISRVQAIDPDRGVITHEQCTHINCDTMYTKKYLPAASAHN